MTRWIHDLIDEPVGDAYGELLSAGLRWCDRGLVVVRNQSALEPSGRRALAELGAFIVERRASASWPGTILTTTRADVYVFTLSAESVQVLVDATRRLFDWVEPALPEDLCLIRASGEPWLVTIAHERDAHLRLASGEVAQARATMPSIGLAERRPLVVDDRI